MKSQKLSWASGHMYLRRVSSTFTIVVRAIFGDCEEKVPRDRSRRADGLARSLSNCFAPRGPEIKCSYACGSKFEGWKNFAWRRRELGDALMRGR